MRKQIRRIMTCCLTAAFILGAAGCGNEGSEDKADDSATQNEDAGTQNEDSSTQEDGAADLSGEVTMSGSTSMEKFANAVAEAFMEQHPGVTVTAEFTGSSAGIEAVLAGSVNIGNSSRNLEDSEKEAGAVENIVAIDGIVVLVNPGNPVKALTKAQLVDIYTGKITNWSDVGGADEPIVVVGREAGSGTRSAFEEILEIVDQCSYANELDSAGTVVAKVASTAGAIGYGSLDMVDDTIVAVDLDGVAANAENVKSGDYFLSRPFVMATVGEISEQGEPVQKLFEYISSDEGQQLIESVGLINVD